MAQGRRKPGQRVTRVGSAALLFGSILPPSAGADATVVQIASASIEVDLPSGELALSSDELVRWVEASAQTVERYYGSFPVSRLSLALEPARGGAIRGTMWGGSVPFIRVRIGSAVTKSDLDEDWRLVHEMIHTAVPELGEGHDWLHEGIATYVEPVARAQYGGIAPEEVWRRFLEGMPHGLAAVNRGGLDGNASWAATYWGGALFCLLGDVAIRERTGNRLGLQDAFEGLRESGASIAQTWDTVRVLEEADSAVGGRTLRDLYAAMNNGGATVDLPELWRALGVARDSQGEVVFDETASQAEIRRSIIGKRQ